MRRFKAFLLAFVFVAVHFPGHFSTSRVVPNPKNGASRPAARVVGFGANAKPEEEKQ
jgi:hypothetical protein